MEVHMLPSGRRFTVEPGDTILEAALRAGVAANYGCANGTCGLCKARVVEGRATKTRFHDYALTAAEKTAGVVLLCSYTAASDLTVEAGTARGTGDIPFQRIVARVRKLERPHADLARLYVQTPRTQRLRFLAGQSVTLGIAPGIARACAIGSCPCDDRNLEFHVARDPADAFAAHVFDALKSGDPVSIEGPSGDFTFDEHSARPAVFVAWDEGFAPIKSLIEHVIALEGARPFTLYWIASASAGRYLDNLCRSWADALDGFRYVPVDATGTGATEIEQTLAVVTRAPFDLRAVDVYLAGPSPVLVVAHDGFARAGLPRSQLRLAVSAGGSVRI